MARGLLEVLEHLQQRAELDALGMRLDLLGLGRKLGDGAGEDDERAEVFGGGGRRGIQRGIGRS
ncbi:hypothetical protein J4558_24940 [Leptolyngbya sp. 15MV]|nr:hypothetical protein J4558_24940 [Leptolyngbya sp. 15MV]